MTVAELVAKQALQIADLTRALQAAETQLAGLRQCRSKLLALQAAAWTRKEKMDRDERVPTADDWEALHDAIVAL